MAVLAAVFLICFMVTRKNSENVREKLPAEACVTVDEWIDDRSGWLSNDEQEVIKSMNYFQNKTGVQPYLLITDNINGKGGDITDSEAEDYLAKLYDSLYRDEGHMIFTFMEYADSEYITYLYTGTAADSVIDAEARGIFLDKADYYYSDSSLSDDEYFAKIFEKSADSIMKDRNTLSRVMLFLAAAFTIITILFAFGEILFRIQVKKTEEAKTLKDIVNAPLGSTPEETELEEKYGREDNSSGD